jgi:hypothetical protein
MATCRTTCRTQTWTRWTIARSCGVCQPVCSMRSYAAASELCSPYFAWAAMGSLLLPGAGSGASKSNSAEGGIGSVFDARVNFFLFCLFPGTSRCWRSPVAL